MRPQKDNDSLKQQWTFVNVSANRDANVPTYGIRNVSSNEFMNAGRLNTANTPHVGNVSPQSSSAPVPHKLTARWQLPASHNPATRGGNFFYMVNNQDVLLRLVDSVGGAPIIEQVANLDDIDSIIQPEDYRWRILEVSPAMLPNGDGEYRIRNLNRETIHTAGDTALSINERGWERGSHRAWEIKSKGNGKCTLKSVDKDKFLSTEKSGNRWVPSLSVNEKEWNIRCDNNFSYTIYVTEKNEYGVISPFAIGADDQIVTLKPMKAAFGQIWLIEPTDAPLPQHPSQQDTTGVKEIVNDLTEGEYSLYNNGARKSIALGANLSLNTDNVISFHIQHVERGKAYIYNIGLAKDFLGLDGQNRPILTTVTCMWNIERSNSGGFYIYRGSLYLGAANTVITAKPRGQVTDNQLWSFRDPE
jgi:hypothetical protein